MKMQWKMTVKVNIVFVAIIILLGGVLNVYFIYHQKKSLNVEMLERAGVVVQNLCAVSEYPLLVVDREEIARLVKATLTQKDVVYCRIEDAQGNLLYQEGTPKNKNVKEFTAPVLTREFSAEFGEDILLGASPPQSKTVGKVTVELSLEDYFRKLRDAITISIFVILLAILLASLVSTLMLRLFFSRPIASLMKGIQKISSGDLNHKVPFRTRDEIGMLAAAFNKMTEDLQNVTVSKDYVDNIISSMAEVLIVLDANMAIKTVNKAGLALFGYEESELLGKTCETFFEFKENYLTSLRELREKGAVTNLEMTCLTKTGQKIPLLLSASLLRDKDEMTHGVLIMGLDITMRKKLESIAMRAEKMSAVGQLAAGVAHEINNPLGVILGFAQSLVSRLSPGDPMDVPLRNIEREAIRCKNLVQDLLTFSRETHGNRAIVDLNDIVESAFSLIKAQARVESVELRKELATELPKILADNNKIQQIVINLANNAFDAMPNGGTLTVKTEFIKDDPLSFVCLRISDTGVGIPQENLSRIFEPFFTTKSVGRGTGLGLSLVYEIVANHSGRIEVQSRPGLTEFIVKFPTRTP